ncbi:hypothetical protein, partial [Salmonella enterica]|uniref:hypothetical protein n=1 Tax=Salmonella enterica TaxID=28901 RepID=UPI0020C216B6
MEEEVKCNRPPRTRRLLGSELLYHTKKSGIKIYQSDAHPAPQWFSDVFAGGKGDPCCDVGKVLRSTSARMLGVLPPQTQI